MARVSFDIERIDPMDLDLETAEAMAEVVVASDKAAGVPIPPTTGPTLLHAAQQGSDGTPCAGLWVLREQGEVVGRLVAEFPWRDNTGSAFLRGVVHPAVRRRGAGRALQETALAAAEAAGRRLVYTGAFENSDGIPALAALGYEPIHTNAIRRVSLHDAPYDLWSRLHRQAAEKAGDYELVRMVGATAPEHFDDMVVLFATINDAPHEDADREADSWTPDRVAAYDAAMAARRQTVYRVVARHRDTGAWAGHSVLCVDEFAPSIAFQEDTSVVRAHRGHRLGLLMKTEMLRWITEERPEVSATDTWNSVHNHHMIAVNEALGATVIARFIAHKLV
jgi:GNAT superfamily N-acetyltransferase